MLDTVSLVFSDAKVGDQVHQAVVRNQLYGTGFGIEVLLQ